MAFAVARSFGRFRALVICRNAMVLGAVPNAMSLLQKE
jgi:hypothetical protein